MNSMRCVYCGLEKTVKNGKSNQGKQRYLCKKCGRIFVENPERRHYPDNLKKTLISNSRKYKIVIILIN